MKIVIPPGHCKWWAVNPAIVLYIDKIVMPSSEFEKICEGRNQNTYHNIVYKTVSLLKDEGILNISDTYFAKDKKILSNFKEQIEEIIKEQNKEKLLQIVKDLIFAYEYWIEYNKKKLKILDRSLKGDYKYMEIIFRDMNIWEEDLRFLREVKYLLKSNEKLNLKRIDRLRIIFNITLSNILAHVYVMLKNAELHHGSAFESLREYEPFFKYIISIPKTIHSHNNQIIKKSLIINFPIIGIKQKKFLREIIDTIGAYLKIREILKNFESIGWDLWEISNKYNIDEVNINKEILKKIRKEISRYKSIEEDLEIVDVISLMLGALGFAPIPFNQIISGLSLFLAFGVKAISEGLKIHSIRKVLKDIVKKELEIKNLSVYFSLLDGVMIPTFLNNRERRLILQNDEFIQVYTPKHWRSSDEEK